MKYRSTRNPVLCSLPPPQLLDEKKNTSSSSSSSSSSCSCSCSCSSSLEGGGSVPPFPELVSFSDAVLRGLAPDGGLFVPIAVPRVSPEELKRWRSLRYDQLCYSVMRLYIDQSEIPDKDLWSLVSRAYNAGKFRCEEIAPVRQYEKKEKKKNEEEEEEEDFFYLELFHGPTYAFKDIALQFVGELFEYLLERRQENLVVVGATSGDTGSAAIAGLRDRHRIQVVVLYPKSRTTKVQELQMTTVNAANVWCICVNGTFDDCQDLVKQCFNSEKLKGVINVGAINSINWARILAQIVYYFYSSFQVQKEKDDNHDDDDDAAEGSTKCFVDFSVPTGNFGNILAGYYARCMGAPIHALIISTNANDILVRCVERGEYHLQPVISTTSPSMDIQVSSNFERFLFDVLGGVGDQVRAKFHDELKNQKGFTLTHPVQDRIKEVFYAFRASEIEVQEAIVNMHSEFGVLLDPHTAVGLVCAKKYRKQKRKKEEEKEEKELHHPLVCVCTAHFGKFYDTLEKFLIGGAGGNVYEQIPDALRMLDELPQYFTSLPRPDIALVEEFLLENFGIAGGCQPMMTTSTSSTSTSTLLPTTPPLSCIASSSSSSSASTQQRRRRRRRSWVLDHPALVVAAALAATFAALWTLGRRRRLLLLR